VESTKTVYKKGSFIKWDPGSPKTLPFFFQRRSLSFYTLLFIL